MANVKINLELEHGNQFYRFLSFLAQAANQILKQNISNRIYMKCWFLDSLCFTMYISIIRVRALSNFNYISINYNKQF